MYVIKLLYSCISILVFLFWSFYFYFYFFYYISICIVLYNSLASNSLLLYATIANVFLGCCCSSSFSCDGVDVDDELSILLLNNDDDDDDDDDDFVAIECRC